MPRRSWQRARQGQLFCIECPEWHVECSLCGERRFLVPMGEAQTARAAEERLKRGETEDDTTGWRKVKGLWQCPKHPAPQEGGA